MVELFRASTLFSMTPADDAVVVADGDDDDDEDDDGDNLISGRGQCLKMHLGLVRQGNSK